MSFLSRLFGGGAEGLAEAGQKVAEIFTTSDREKLAAYEAETDRIRATQALDLAQSDINKIEARSRSLFIAGWRPMIGWVSGFGLCWHFILSDLARWGIALSGSEIEMPELTGTEEMIPLVLAMLGLGGLRTYEKRKGLTR